MLKRRNRRMKQRWIRGGERRRLISMGGCWLMWGSVTIRWSRLSVRCIRLRILLTMRKIGIYFGQILRYSAIDSIGWSHIRGSTIFLGWTFLVERICLLEICSECKKSFQKNTTFSLRHGFYHMNMLILENSLKTSRRIKRKHLSLNLRLHAKVKEFFCQETSTI